MILCDEAISYINIAYMLLHAINICILQLHAGKITVILHYYLSTDSSPDITTQRNKQCSAALAAPPPAAVIPTALQSQRSFGGKGQTYGLREKTKTLKMSVVRKVSSWQEIRHVGCPDNIGRRTCATANFSGKGVDAEKCFPDTVEPPLGHYKLNSCFPSAALILFNGIPLCVDIYRALFNCVPKIPLFRIRLFTCP